MLLKYTTLCRWMWWVPLGGSGVLGATGTGITFAVIGNSIQWSRCGIAVAILRGISPFSPSCYNCQGVASRLPLCGAFHPIHHNRLGSARCGIAFAIVRGISPYPPESLSTSNDTIDQVVATRDMSRPAKPAVITSTGATTSESAVALTAASAAGAGSQQERRVDRGRQRQQHP